MATALRLLGRKIAALARQNPGNVRDGLNAIHGYVMGRTAPPVRNPRRVQELANPAAGNELVVANGSTRRRWLWWLAAIGGGLIGGGAIFWLFRRGGGQGAEIANAVEDNAGGGGGDNAGNAGNANGGGGGGIDPGFLLFQMINAICWNGGDNSSNGVGDAAATTAPSEGPSVSNGGGDAAAADGSNAGA